MNRTTVRSILNGNIISGTRIHRPVKVGTYGLKKKVTPAMTGSKHLTRSVITHR